MSDTATKPRHKWTKAEVTQLLKDGAAAPRGEMMAVFEQWSEKLGTINAAGVRVKYYTEKAKRDRAAAKRKKPAKKAAAKQADVTSIVDTVASKLEALEAENKSLRERNEMLESALNGLRAI